MTIPGREGIASSLTSFVHRVCTDPVARRALRLRPQEALREHGLAPPPIDGELAILHHAVSVMLSEAALFGGPADLPPPTIDPPLELRLAAAGVKPVALLHAPESDGAGIVRWAEARALPAVLGPFELDVEAEAGKGGFVDRAEARRWTRPGSCAWRPVLVGVAGNHDDVVVAWLSLLFGWNELLGLVLGYPRCCASAFDARWQEAVREHDGDVEAVAIGAGLSDRRPWELNVAARFLTPTLIQHFPCRPDCGPSLAIARRHLAVMRALDPAAAEQIERLLTAPLVHAGADGVVALVGGVVHDDGSVTYAGDAAAATADTETIRRVRSAHRLTAGDLPPGCHLVTFTRGSDALVRTA